jgi:hypothetical protein
MSRKSPPPAIADKPYKVTFGVKQTEKICKAANKQNQSPREFMREATMEVCETANKVPAL